MKSPNWTEPRVYTNPEGKPICITIYDKDDAREVCSVNLATYDGPEHVARVKAEFALIAQAPGWAKTLDQIGRHAHAATADGMTAKDLRAILHTIGRGAFAAVAKAGL